jgi:hypothetical protein
VGVLLAALGLGYEALRGGLAGRRAAFLGVLLLLACATPWARHLVAGGADPLLVIADSALPVQSEPRSDAARTGELRPGQRVERTGTFITWTQVRLPGGEVGWVPSAAVFPLAR